MVMSAMPVPDHGRRVVVLRSSLLLLALHVTGCAITAAIPPEIAPEKAPEYIHHKIFAIVACDAPIALYLENESDFGWFIVPDMADQYESVMDEVLEIAPPRSRGEIDLTPLLERRGISCPRSM